LLLKIAYVMNFYSVIIENLDVSGSGSGCRVPDESDFDDDIDHSSISTLLPISKSMFRAYYLLENVSTQN
jgi:hypothetical protein